MRVALRRPPLWMILFASAVALEILSIYVATFPVYVNRFTGVQPCAANCVELFFGWEPTYPFVLLGVILFASGAVVMGTALAVLRRAPRRPSLRSASA